MIHPLAGRGYYGVLGDNDLTVCHYVAQCRQNDAETNDYIPGNNLDVDRAQQLEINRVGARGERAAHLFFPHLTWHRGPYAPRQPDLGSFIDVKTVDRKGSEMRKKTSLIVQRKDGHPFPHWAYLLTAELELGFFWIGGWLWGFEVAQQPVKQLQPNRPAYVAELKILHSLRILHGITCPA